MLASRDLVESVVIRIKGWLKPKVMVVPDLSHKVRERESEDKTATKHFGHFYRHFFSVSALGCILRCRIFPSGGRCFQIMTHCALSLHD